MVRHVFGTYRMAPLQYQRNGFILHRQYSDAYRAVDLMIRLQSIRVRSLLHAQLAIRDPSVY